MHIANSNHETAKDNTTPSSSSIFKKLNPFHKDETIEEKIKRRDQKIQNKLLVDKYGHWSPDQRDANYFNLFGTKGSKKGSVILAAAAGGGAGGGGGGGGC